MKKSNRITPTYVRVQVQEAWGPQMALPFILKIGFLNFEWALQDLVGKWCHMRATLVFQSWIQSPVCVPWIQKSLDQKGHSILEFLLFCTLVLVGPLYTWPRAMTMKYEGLWKSFKSHSMWNRNAILQSMDPQAYYRVKVDHVEGTQNISSSSGPHHNNIIFWKANTNSIDCQSLLFCARSTSFLWA